MYKKSNAVVLNGQGAVCGIVSGSNPNPNPNPNPGPTQSGKTTRYWDCCKPSCSWSGKASVSKEVVTCKKDGTSVLSDANAKSVCDGGETFMCSNQQPFYENGMSYGFAATHISGGSERSWCCACYQIQASGGRSIVVQVTNTGSDLGSNHFDIQIPGGGFGIFDGCTKQWGASEATWGARYGGVMTAKISCSGLPSQLKAGCEWQNEHWGNNPSIESFWRVKCPATLTSKSACRRTDE